MNRRRHPSSRRLLRWLDAGDEGLDRHLATCGDCADRLESLVDEPDHVLSTMLARVLAAPEQIPERLQSAIDERMSSRRELTLIGELFALPIRTARVISTSESGDE